MMNLRFVEMHASSDGPYETTQLINSFLCALAHPWEEMKADLMAVPLGHIEALGWPALVSDRGETEPTSLGHAIRLLRNGMAHGNIELIGNSVGEIASVRIWNNDKQGYRTWGTRLSILSLRDILIGFTALIEERHERFGWYSSLAA